MFIYLPFLFFFSFILVLAVVFPKFRIYWQKVKVVFGSSIFLSALVIITTLFDFLKYPKVIYLHYCIYIYVKKCMQASILNVKKLKQE